MWLQYLAANPNSGTVPVQMRQVRSSCRKYLPSLLAAVLSLMSAASPVQMPQLEVDEAPKRQDRQRARTLSKGCSQVTCNPPGLLIVDVQELRTTLGGCATRYTSRPISTHAHSRRYVRDA